MSNAPKLRKLALTSGIVAVMAGLLGLGTYSAFTATTSNDGNTFASGTVAVGDNDGNAALYVKSNQKPGDVTNSCITVTYTGSLAASIKLYMSSVTNGGDYDLQIDRGTAAGAGAFPDCGTFTVATNVYTGTLGAFASANYDWASSTALGKNGGAAWNNGDTITYRFRVTQRDDAVADNRKVVKGTGTHTITWEAQNN